MWCLGSAHLRPAGRRLDLRDHLAVVDHANDTIHLVALSGTSSQSKTAALRWLDLAEAIVRKAAGRCAARAEFDQPESPNPGALRASAETALVRDREQYLADILHCKEKLLAGETYEVCVTNTLLFPRTVDPLHFYTRLRRRNPAPYSAYLSTGGVQIAGARPATAEIVKFIDSQQSGSESSRWPPRTEGRR